MQPAPDHQPDTNNAPNLRLAGEMELKLCPSCAGRGSVPCPQTVAVRTLGLNAVPALQPSTGHPVPCPQCQGKKVVTTG